MTVYPVAADYATARPSPEAVKAAGYVAVWRYLSPAPNDKNLTKPEADALLAAGLGIGTIWESTANRALDADVAGTLDGHAAAVEAHAIGQVPGSPLLANLGDFAATGAEIPAIHAYYHAFREAIGDFQPGGYATGFIINALVARGAIGLWWQNAMDDSGVLGSVVSRFASVYQRVKPTKVIAGIPAGSWDEDAFGFGPDHPKWWTAAPAPQPPPVTHQYTVVALADGSSFRAASGAVLP